MSSLTLISEYTTQKRPGNGRDTVHRPNEACIHWTLHQGDGVRDDYQGPGKDTRASNPSNRASYDQSDRVRRNAANQTSQFEDGNSDEVDPFYTEEGIEFAEQELKGGRSEEVARAVSDIEVVCTRRRATYAEPYHPTSSRE
jgi:hypothetical protein